MLIQSWIGLNEQGLRVTNPKPTDLRKKKSSAKLCLNVFLCWKTNKDGVSVYILAAAACDALWFFFSIQCSRPRDALLLACPPSTPNLIANSAPREMERDGTVHIRNTTREAPTPVAFRARDRTRRALHNWYPGSRSSCILDLCTYIIVAPWLWF